MAKRTLYRTVFSAILLGWLVPALAWAQIVSVAGADGTAAAVEQLSQQATALYSTPAKWGEAGALLEQAGRMLPVEDPVGVGLLKQAAQLQAHVGDLARARANMKEVGWRALGQGSVVLAANAYADAALIAVEQGDLPAARQLVDIVQLLSRWPGVNASQRRQILKRIA